jgi:CSLREA domain-containing protein
MRLALLVCLSTVGSVSIFGATFTVNSTADALDAAAGNGVCETATGNGICTLRAAITEANVLAGDDIITLPAGIYTNTLVGEDNSNRSGDLDINSNITINGAGSGTTFIQAAAAPGTASERVLQFLFPNITVVLNDVTIRNGREAVSLGGGVNVENFNQAVTFNNCVIRDNFSGFGGGGIALSGTRTASVALNNTIVTDNTVSGNNDRAPSPGGGGGILLNYGGTLTATNSTISNNTVTLSGSSSSLGGGIGSILGTVTLTNSTIIGNKATATAGAGTYGGGISLLSGTVNIINSNIVKNVAWNAGGGVYNQEGTLNITNSTVGENNAGFGGGISFIAVNIAAMTTVNNSAIVNNTAAEYPGGGGIGNYTEGAANAVFNLNNSTVSGNTAGVGGGISNSAGGSGNAVININFSTVAANSALRSNGQDGAGGGIYNEGEIGTGISVVNLKNSVVANNTTGTYGAGPDIRGIITSQGYNLVENTYAGIFVTTAGDEIHIDPSLGALGLNGGTTLNYLPNPGSPLIDRIPNGINGCGGFDQRGVSRPADSDMNGVAACEKGSTERASAPTAASVSVTGRILTSSGRGIANAVVAMTDPGGNTRFARTSTLGYYRFDDVQVGGTYIFTVSSKRYEFGATVRTITEETNNLNFVAP